MSRNFSIFFLLLFLSTFSFFLERRKGVKRKVQFLTLEENENQRKEERGREELNENEKEKKNCCLDDDSIQTEKYLKSERMKNGFFSLFLCLFLAFSLLFSWLKNVLPPRSPESILVIDLLSFPQQFSLSFFLTIFPLLLRIMKKLRRKS